MSYFSLKKLTWSVVIVILGMPVLMFAHDPIERVIQNTPNATVVGKQSSQQKQTSQQKQSTGVRQQTQKQRTPVKPNVQKMEDRIDLATSIPPLATQYAVLIGFDVNENDPGRLCEFCDQDVMAMASQLKNMGWKEKNIITMTSQSSPFVLQPTRSNILAIIRLIARESELQDTIFVMISGNGGMGEGRQWFLPRGATSLKDNRWLALDEVVSVLSKSKASEIVVMNLTDRYVIHKSKTQQPEKTAELVNNKTEQSNFSVVQGQRRPVKTDQKRKQNAVTVIYSCTTDEEGLESTEDKLDLFLAHYLSAVKNLVGKGKNSFKFVDAFAAAKQSTTAAAKQKGETQVPEMKVCP